MLFATGDVSRGNVLSGKERGETAVSAGCKSFKLLRYLIVLRKILEDPGACSAGE